MARPDPSTDGISLALVFHNHQPVGNFGWVIADAYERAYLPMVEALERHPAVRAGLHYTGPLLRWIRAERPAFLPRLAALAARGQVELLGGGYYEPVLSALPDRDRLSQLRRMADEIELIAGRRPSGAWLAERVWEPDLPTSIVDAGYAWTIVDDAHFRAAGLNDTELWGPYLTEDQGRRLALFASDRKLRYAIPYKPVEEVIDGLVSDATSGRDRLAFMGDDGEKFGAWPTTFEHCWGKGRWVDRFFEALESNAAWLTTVRPSDWLGSNPPVGRIYVPTGSYAEMGEWALPPDESRAFTAAMHHAQETKAPERRWLRGAFWRNFQVKYREINDLHKQMLRTSARVETMPSGAAREAALDHLYRGQSNDCYWHGLFGGIYIAHMRAATLAHLIAAEDAADRELGTQSGGELRDLDLDGRDEVRLASDGEVVTIDLDEGGGIGAWDLRAARHALTGVLRRRPEAYHEILRRHEAEAQRPPKGKGAGDAPASIHDIVQVKEPGLAARLVYDDYERRSGLLRVLPRDATAASWAAGGRGDLADFVGCPYRIVRLDRDVATMARDGHATVDGMAYALSVETEVSIAGGRLDPTLRWTTTVRNDGDRAFEARLGSEWALTMLGGGGNPEAWWEIEGERTGHDGTGAASRVDQVGQGNSWLGLSVATSVSPSADAWHAPIETISNSEAGFERVYQGGALLLSWVVRIAPGGSWSATIEHRATVAVDRAEEELGAVLANRA